jgi:hypothetical protein
MEYLKYWSPNEFDVSLLRFGLNKKKTKLGTDNTESCIYTYNELGFRADSIYSKGFKVMSIGCSNTEGVAVNDNETWPHQFTKMIPKGVNLNLGASGRSNDYICRCLMSYYDLIQPNLVLIMYTSPQRREAYTKNRGIKPFIPGSSWNYLRETEDGRNIQNNLTELQNDNEDFINWYKNHTLIKLFLESKRCNWLWNGAFNIPKEYDEYNRFDGGYFNHPFLDLGVDGGHPGPLHNKTYAEKLYNHITNNFSNYLPKENQTYDSKLI